MKKMNYYRTITAVLGCLALGLCSAQTTFIDKTSALGVKIGSSHIVCIDYNNDGLVDIYSPDALWKNNPDRSFTKIDLKGGNAVWADFNNDGYADFFSFSARRLFYNNRDDTFSEQPFPKLPINVSVGACCGDYNNDGFVDIYICGYEDWKDNKTYPDVMLLNNQGKSWEVSFSDDRYRARGATSCDFDNDGDVDIYISNYRLAPNVLWLNDGKGNLTDVAPSLNAIAAATGFAGGHSIGAVWADFDNDGNFDIFAGNFAHQDKRGNQPQSVMLRSRGPKEGYAFQNMGQCGIHYQESYASPAAADFDNDGDVDLFLTTVYATASFGKKNYPVLYRNEGDWKFVDVTKESGLGKLGDTYQAAWADINNDGHIDLITNGRIFINQGSSGNWLKVKLRGDGNTVNKDAIGCQIRIKLNEKTITRQVEAGTGQGNQNELTMHLGLGNHSDPMDVDIFWTKKHTQTIKNIMPNRLITVNFEAANTKTSQP